MESPEIALIAFIDGWYIINLKGEVLQGPYESYKEACSHAEIRAYRLKQGWAP